MGINENVAEKYGELCEKIRYHMDRYYNQDTPEISDYEYDQLMIELRQMEKEHPELVTEDSPTRIIGGSARSGTTDQLSASMIGGWVPRAIAWVAVK